MQTIIFGSFLKKLSCRAHHRSFQYSDLESRTPGYQGLLDVRFNFTTKDGLFLWRESRWGNTGRGKAPV